jgi:hypothetical protein
MRIFLFLFFFANLWANNLVITYPNLKKNYYKNQIVNLQIKILNPKNEELNFALNKGEINITKKPYLYLLNLKFKNDLNNILYLYSDKNFKTINLNSLFKTKILEKIPKFCNVLADNLKISNPISTLINNKILLSFTIKTKNGNLEDFKLNNEENLTLINNKEATYYIYLPKETKNLYFYYFNTQDENYKKITVPIILKEEIISTQTDINPEEKSFFTPFNILLLTIIAFFIIIFLIYQNIIILIIPIILTVYLIITLLPKGERILKRNSEVKILPTKNSTIFYKPTIDIKVKILNKTKNYTKIKIDNKIGWVKNEDLK